MPCDVKLAIPENVKSLGLTPYTYKWYVKLREVLNEICPGYSFGWKDTIQWEPDYVFVDRDTAIYLIIKHEFTEVKDENE